MLAAAGVLSACGDSGPGILDGGGEIIGGVPVIIDGTNVQVVAATGAQAAITSAQLGGLFDDIGVTASQPGIVSKPGATEAAVVFAKQALNAAAVSAVPLPETTTDCLVSGTITVSGDVADLDTFTAGDFLVADADMCDDGNGQVVDGLLDLTITSFSGDSTTGLYLIGLNLVATAFSTTTLTGTSTLDGAFSTELDTRTLLMTTGRVFGNGLTVTSGTTQQSLTNFSAVYVQDDAVAPFAWTIDALGIANTTGVEGAVDYVNVTQFAGSGMNLPSSGELQILGGESSSLLLIVLDQINVQIEADYDGDSTIDETINLTWAELLAQI